MHRIFGTALRFLPLLLRHKLPSEAYAQMSGLRMVGYLSDDASGGFLTRSKHRLMIGCFGTSVPPGSTQVPEHE